MSARYIHDAAPLGALIRFSDGTTRPPDRHKRKLSAWKDNNDTGRLISKRGPIERPTYSMPAEFTLHMADFGGGGVIVMRVHRSFALNSGLAFEIAERPRAGMARVLDRRETGDQLLHLAADRAAAEVWLAEYRNPNAAIELVTDDEAASHSGERSAA
jgi:hypothetical protein